MNKLVALVLLFAGISCVHSQIVKFDPTVTAAPVAPETVAIYRSTRPQGGFKELGLISFRTQINNPERIYERLRKDAAVQGATAVVDVKVNGETHTEPDTVTSCIPRTRCDSNGNCVTDNICTTHFTTRRVTTYLVVGSMIRSPP